MSIWTAVAGGLLHGVGTGLVARDDERRQMRGIQLQEAYLRQRQEGQQKFQAKEAELARAGRQADIKLSGGMELGRTLLQMGHSSSEADKGRQHDIDMADLNNRYAEERQSADQGFRGEENRLQREHEITLAGMRDAINGAANKTAEEMSIPYADMTMEQKVELITKIGKLPQFDRFVEAYNSAGYGARITNADMLTKAISVVRSTNELPWDIPLSADDLLLSMVNENNKNYTLDNVVGGLLASAFTVPDHVVLEAWQRINSVPPENSFVSVEGEDGKVGTYPIEIFSREEPKQAKPDYLSRRNAANRAITRRHHDTIPQDNSLLDRPD